jgi:membrane protein DedA with SNARE-associated domain
MTALISGYGALGVFLLMIPESACIPVPSEVTLTFAGFAVTQHWMSFPLAVLAATAGNVLGSLLAYAGGAAARHLPQARRLLCRSDRLLGEHPMRAVFTARLLPLARTFVSLPAGAQRVPLVPFTALTAAGCAVWATAFVFLGVLTGTAWASVSSLAGKVSLAAVVLAGAAYVVRRLRRR